MCVHARACVRASHLHERGEMLRLTAVTRHARVHLDHHREAWKLAEKRHNYVRLESTLITVCGGWGEERGGGELQYNIVSVLLNQH